MRFVTLALLISVATGCGHRKELEAMVHSQSEQIAHLEAEKAERDGTIATLEAQVADLDVALTRERERAERMLTDQGALAFEVEEMRSAIAELEARKASAEARVEAFKDLVARFRTLIDAGTLEVKIVDGRMVVALHTDILFESGSATLSEDGKKALTEVALILRDMPENKFQIEGHTDNVPIRSEKYPSNWTLASARAIGVVHHLVDAGVAPTQLSAASYSEYAPVAANDSPEGKASNRRIEIVVVPDLTDLPGTEELNGIATTDATE